MDDFYDELNAHEMNELYRDGDWDEDEDEEREADDLCESDEDYHYSYSWGEDWRGFCAEE